MMVAINFNNLAVATQVLTALISQVSQYNDGVLPCATEGGAILTCLEQNQDSDCLSCIYDAAHLPTEEGVTCEQIAASNFCSDLTTCIVSTCRADCSAEWQAWGFCMDAWAVAANVDPAEECVLCPGRHSFATMITAML
jgi:hypothetical protein